MKVAITKRASRVVAISVLIITATSAIAQVASHAPTVLAPAQAVAGKPVAQVNGTVLTDRDLLREMYAIFPYARQHNGFPKAMEPQIRQGALEMIIFEELVYQHALRRKMTIPPVRLQRAEQDFRKQFSSAEEFQQYLKVECNGSAQAMREKVRRSLLIEALLKAEIHDKSMISPAEVKAYYDSNPKNFQHGESFAIQTISIIPPQNAGPEAQKEARKRAEDALRRAKATKSYRDFGLLAEQISDDDWHVKMGDRNTMEADKLPPPLVQAARAMKPGEVSGLMQFGPNYTLFRLNAYVPAGQTEFQAVKAKLRSDLEKAKAERLRADLNRRLRQNANVKVL